MDLIIPRLKIDEEERDVSFVGNDQERDLRVNEVKRCQYRVYVYVFSITKKSKRRFVFEINKKQTLNRSTTEFCVCIGVKSSLSDRIDDDDVGGGGMSSMDSMSHVDAILEDC